MLPLPTHRLPTHPGEILLEEFLKPLGISQVDLAKHIAVPVNRVNEIVNGRRGVSPETAILFAGAFGTTAELWMGLQADYDLATAARKTRGVRRLPQVEA